MEVSLATLKKDEWVYSPDQMWTKCASSSIIGEGGEGVTNLGGSNHMRESILLNCPVWSWVQAQYKNTWKL